MTAHCDRLNCFKYDLKADIKFVYNTFSMCLPFSKSGSKSGPLPWQGANSGSTLPNFARDFDTRHIFKRGRPKITCANKPSHQLTNVNNYPTIGKSI